MKITGIIAEYNPFHEGHAWQIEQCQKLMKPDLLVVVVSGWFSSRGLPSLISPELKTIEALKHGADLVVELPVIYTAQAAHQFAWHAASILANAGVNTLCFGSESNDLDYLQRCAAEIETLEKNPALSMAVNTASSVANLRPNDILAVQYLRACSKLDIEPYPVLRNQSLRSATSLRKDFFEGKLSEGHDYLPFQNWNHYYPYLRYQLMFSSPKTLEQFFLVSEGIENRLKKAAEQHSSWEDFLEACISKTYTRARIQRTCLMILLQIKKEQISSSAPLHGLKVLGFSAKGRELLKNLGKDVPVYTKFAALPLLWKELDRKTANIVELASGRKIPFWKVITA